MRPVSNTSCLFFLTTECLSVALVGSLLNNGVDLLRSKSREVVKPALLFVKVRRICTVTSENYVFKASVITMLFVITINRLQLYKPLFLFLHALLPVFIILFDLVFSPFQVLNKF